MKRLACTVLVLTLLCGCGNPVQNTTSPQETILETSQRGMPGFDPALIIDTMSTEQLVGQLFLARCPSDESALADLEQYHLGGYILFGRDFEDKTAAEIQATIDTYQNTATIPLLIAVDEEGGTVARISSQTQLRESRFPSPRKLYAEGGIELLLKTEEEKCNLLSSLGINVNMAPVCDVTTEPNAFMYSRSLGLSPADTAVCIAAMVETMSQHQIGSVLKHFPGYGNNADTHTGIATDNRPIEQLEQVDLLPFQSGIDAGSGAVLISHTIVTGLDSQFPASMSPLVIQYLRDQMGFDGVVVTDDLVMSAITELYGAQQAAVMAVLAGNDLLCSSQYEIQYEAVLQAVQDGRISMEQIRQAVSRILQWKYTLGLLPANI